MDFARTFLARDLRTNLEVKEEAKYEIREEATRSLLHKEDNPGTSSVFGGNSMCAIKKDCNAL